MWLGRDMWCGVVLVVCVCVGGGGNCVVWCLVVCVCGGVERASERGSHHRRIRNC